MPSVGTKNEAVKHQTVLYVPSVVASDSILAEFAKWLGDRHLFKFVN